MSFKRIGEKKGIALIMALWIMTILVMVTASFAFMMRTEIKMASNFRDEVQAHYLARAGVEYAIAILRNDSVNSYDYLGEPWANIGTLPLGRGQFTVTVEDEQGKVNINTATPTWDNDDSANFPNVGTSDVTSGGGLMSGLYAPRNDRTKSNNPISATAGKIRDFRDINTAGNWDDSSLKSQPFDTAREVVLVTGCNLQTSKHNKGWITIWSAGAASDGTNPHDATYKPGNNSAGCGMININTAGYDWDAGDGQATGPLRAVVETVLDPVDGLTNDECEPITQDLYNAREASPYETVNDIIIDGGWSSKDEGEYLRNSNYFTVQSDYFRITSTGEVLRGGEVIAQSKVEAVIDRNFVDDGTMGPIEILYWSESVQRYEAEDE